MNTSIEYFTKTLIKGWVSDHDLDSPLNAGDGEGANGIPNGANVQVAVFGGRGFLIESQGPSWFYGTASEHSVLYQYNLFGSNDIYLGHMQTETPYFQPDPPATSPFSIGQFNGDPKFENCNGNKACEEAWALRIINSTNIFIYSAGFYSFFQNFNVSCAATENCQESVIDIGFSEGVWMYNVFTKGAIQVISPETLMPLYQVDANQTSSEYTSEICAWLPFALAGADIGNPPSGAKPLTFTVTEGNGQVSTISETLSKLYTLISDPIANTHLVPITTTNKQGQPITEISIAAGPSVSPPPGAIVTTITTVGQDGTTTIVVKTLGN